MKLRVLGCGEAFDTGVGNNACLLYGGRADPVVLFDCGYQIPERLWALPRLYPRLDAIYLTHLHADHCFGIVPLLTRFKEEGRTRELTIFGPRGCRALLTRLLDLGYPGMSRKLPFKIDWRELAPGDSVQWRSLRLQTARSAHSVLNLAVRVEGKGLSFAVSGDGQLTDATRRLFGGVGILLHEVYSRDGGLETHSDLRTLSEFASKSAIHRLGITHISRHEKSKVRGLLERLRRREPGRWLELKPGLEMDLRAIPREHDAGR